MDEPKFGSCGPECLFPSDLFQHLDGRGEGTTTISNPNVTVNGATGAEITALTEITAGPLASAETSTDVREVQPQRPYVGHARWARHW